MRLPMDYEERIAIVDNTLIEFSTIKEWQEKKMLEYGDVFIQYKNNNYGFAIVYLDNKFMKIVDNRLQAINETELIKEIFYNKNVLGSPYKEFISRKGSVEFEELTEYDRCDVFKGDYFNKKINALMDEIIDYCEEAK